jgi:hypothetical protein
VGNHAEWWLIPLGVVTIEYLNLLRGYLNLSCWAQVFTQCQLVARLPPTCHAKRLCSQHADCAWLMPARSSSLVLLLPSPTCPTHGLLSAANWLELSQALLQLQEQKALHAL